MDKNEGSTIANKSAIGSRWINPTWVELNCGFFVLGAHVVIASDVAISAAWWSFVTATLTICAGVVLVRCVCLGLYWRQKTLIFSRWSVLASLVAALSILHGTNAAVVARVALSQRELLAYVKWIEESPHLRTTKARTAGLFTIQAAYKDKAKIGERDGVVWLETVTGRRLRQPPYSIWAGLVYSPSGIPPSTGDSSYWHLFGPWWAWFEDL